MPVVLVDLAQGVVSAAGRTAAVQPVPGGALRVGSGNRVAVLRPLTFGERSHAVRLAAGGPDAVAAVAASVRCFATVSADEHDVMHDVVALVLAGADADRVLPSYVDAALLVARAVGAEAGAWSAAQAAEVDALAARLVGPTADEGWTRLELAPLTPESVVERLASALLRRGAPPEDAGPTGDPQEAGGAGPQDLPASGRAHDDRPRWRASWRAAPPGGLAGDELGDVRRRAATGGLGGAWPATGTASATGSRGSPPDAGRRPGVPGPAGAEDGQGAGRPGAPGAVGTSPEEPDRRTRVARPPEPPPPAEHGLPAALAVHVPADRRGPPATGAGGAGPRRWPAPVEGPSGPAGAALAPPLPASWEPASGPVPARATRSPSRSHGWERSAALLRGGDGAALPAAMTPVPSAPLTAEEDDASLATRVARALEDECDLRGYHP